MLRSPGTEDRRSEMQPLGAEGVSVDLPAGLRVVTLEEAALAAGALQLGEDGSPDGPHFIFSLEQLERFVREVMPTTALPPLPY